MAKAVTFFILAVCTILCASLPLDKQPDEDPAPDHILFWVSDKPEPLVIKCGAHAPKSGVKYSWQKDGEALSSKPSADNEGTLVIPHPSKEDDGHYRCFAESDLGVASSKIIHVHRAFIDAPKVTPQKLKPVEGRTFKLDCHIPNAHPEPEVYWTYQPAGSNEAKNVQDKRITQNSEGNLYFSNATKEDAGKYVCLAKSSAVDHPVPLAEYDIEGVTPDTKPKDNEVVEQYVTPDVEIILGTSTYLYCIYGGNPLAHPDWFKDGKDTNKSPDDRVTRYNRSVGKRLLIKEVRLEDEGTYTCVINNEVGKVQKHTFQVTVVSPPYVNVGAKEKTVKEGEDVTLTCEISGKPTPKTIWTHNAKPLPHNEKLHVEESSRGDVFVSALTIKKAQKGDSGYYGCMEENKQGDDYQETLLIVS